MIHDSTETNFHKNEIISIGLPYIAAWHSCRMPKSSWELTAERFVRCCARKHETFEWLSFRRKREEFQIFAAKFQGRKSHDGKWKRQRPYRTPDDEFNQVISGEINRKLRNNTWQMAIHHSAFDLMPINVAPMNQRFSECNWLVDEREWWHSTVVR